MLVTDFIADQLVRRGIRHVFGVGGANIEDMFAAVQRRRPEICVVLSKHEHAAGSAASSRRLGDRVVRRVCVPPQLGAPSLRAEVGTKLVSRGHALCSYPPTR